MFFTATFSATPPDGAWGRPTGEEDGGFNGMVGQIMRNEADLSPAGFVVTEARQRVIDYLQPIFVADMKIFFREISRLHI